MYKLIAIDLDGTLLNSYNNISKENKNAINNAIKKGIKVILASGRPTSSVKNFCKELDIQDFCISGNGAIVFDIKNNKEIYSNSIEKKKVLQIIKICEENSIFYSMHTKNAILTKSLNYNVSAFYNENLNKPQEQKTNIKIVTDMTKFIEENNEIYKITITDNDKIIFNNIIRKLKTIKNINVLDVAHMSKKMIKSGSNQINIEYFYTEITNQDVNKWNAIEFLINRLKINKENVIAIGDNANDIEMLQNSGIGIAMGNSADYIKKIASYVTLNNEEDGVAQAISKILQ